MPTMELQSAEGSSTVTRPEEGSELLGPVVVELRELQESVPNTNEDVPGPRRNGISGGRGGSKAKKRKHVNKNKTKYPQSKHPIPKSNPPKSKSWDKT